MRVPTGGRTCRVIWPASTDGKKFEPRNGASANDATHDGQEADHEDAPVGQRHGQQVAIALAEPLEPRLEAALEARERIARPWPRSCLVMRAVDAASAGTSPWSAPACATG